MKARHRYVPGRHLITLEAATASGITQRDENHTMHPNPRLKQFSDVHKLSRRITAEELQERYGDDYEAFTFLAVAEAVMTSLPLGVVTWLRQPYNSADWVEALVHQEAVHQIAEWTRTMELGATHDRTIQAHTTRQAIRDRLVEARKIALSHTEPVRHSRAEAAALNRLCQAHPTEYEQLKTELSQTVGVALHTSVPPSVQQLLDLDHEAFRALVASDVKNQAREPDLAHGAVSGRWHRALVELGARTFATLGLPDVPVDASIDPARFAVADSWLPAGPLSRQETRWWADRLTFIAHVRVRMTERARLTRVAKRERSEHVIHPAQHQLRMNHFPEYARYRLQAERRIVGSTSESASDMAITRPEGNPA